MRNKGMSQKSPILATSPVTIKYPITYRILYTIMQVSLPYCLVKVKFDFHCLHLDLKKISSSFFSSYST